MITESDHGVGLVDLVERNAVDLQPPSTGALALFDHRGEGRDRKDLAGQRDRGTLVAECLAEDALTLAHRVHLGRIEQRDPQSQGALHDVASGTRGVAVPVTPFA
jgi:hypothetical protein